uniref:Selenocysteine-specific elongation factor n=1 Tax=Neomoorella thermoacetica TaxID=1525 RepID=UPI00004C4E3C|nr:Chain A, Selenocysteine-specific elongation factor [Moorella thermoacetica]1WSU_B Chain B, Selenocysteine-specific elongation factor [Moorella thermoacetica]1WSU_C Chain C, Selenocysteine-specific elongation factor [Moorella thermoacetica]1WSU_D Chain D, Selenocysteine-specific elongation factor [Moorella thermoacetica]
GSETQKKLLKDLEDKYRVSRWQPPSFKEVAGSFNLDPSELEELLHYLVREGVLVKINDEFYWHRQALGEAREVIKNLASTGPFGLAEARDALGSSRKYVLPLLEYLDQVKFTRRVGDKRVVVGN